MRVHGSSVGNIMWWLSTEDIGETHFGGFLKRKRPLVETGEEVSFLCNKEVGVAYIISQFLVKKMQRFFFLQVRPKTKQQIMNELVAKSKAMKVSSNANLLSL